jgi:hypothetical protein
MSGARTEGMKANGRITRCMAMESPNGLTEGNIKASIIVIKSMGLAHFTGLMAENTTVLGKMGSNMVEASTI